MAEREYIVTVNSDVDITAFDAEMVSKFGSETIPNREVVVANAREASRRSTHFFLSDDEAETLRADERVLAVEIPVEERDDVEISLRARQSGTFYRGSGSAGNIDNWGLKRCQSLTENYGNGSTPSGEQIVTQITDDYLYPLDGHGVDVVIQDSGIQVNHPEFLMDDTDEYISTPLVADNTNGAVFDRSLYVHGLKFVVAGAVGGATAVPDTYVDKVAQTVKLIIDPTGNGINLRQQKRLIATLKGDPGTYHAGIPAAQRMGYGGGSSYTPNWLTDDGAATYAGYIDFLDSHVVNDMVWYANTSGPNPTTQQSEIEEVMEHLFHTIHMFGIPGAVPGSEDQVVMASDAKYSMDNTFDWRETELHKAMQQAIDGGKFDPSGYSTAYNTDGASGAEAASVAYKEYTYLLNWGMWNMSEFWDGGSLSPEWTDDMRTPEGIKENNPLGYALFKKYFEPVLSKPSFTTLKSIFKGANSGRNMYRPSNGYSRVQEIDWYDESGVTGTQDTVFYTDLHGHGTHCTGTVAGKTFGWAKKARIYSMKLGGLEGSTDPDNGISITNSFDCIRQWHNLKPVDPVTGVKRPTIVNMSWGYGTNIPQAQVPASGNYRGTAWTYGVEYSNISQVWANTGVVPYVGSRWKIPVQVAYVDAETADLVAAGAHVCIAAGNDYYKVDVATGADYNNTVTFTGYGTYNYHRPPSPYATTAFNVGNIDSRILNDQDVTKPDSMKGPAVTIWAPGTNIISACSQISEIGGPTPYKLDGSFGQQSISGTSMASPQVCGVGALHLQADPALTPAQLKQKLEDNSPAVMFTTGSDTDYNAYTTSIMGSAGKILYNKYKTDEAHKLEGSVTITNLGIA